MAVLGAGKRSIMEQFWSSLAQSVARMARKRIIIVYFLDMVWLALI